MRRIVARQIRWRGSITDLATDVADLLTPQEGAALIVELVRFHSEPHLRQKWAGSGHEDVHPPPEERLLRAPEMFAIGSPTWPGLSKLAEEAGEMTQVVCSVGSHEHRRQLIEEIGDVLAACDFVGLANAIEVEIAESSKGHPSLSMAVCAGRVVQVIGKLMGTGGQVDHWDGTNLRLRLIEEIGKLRAACESFGVSSDLQLEIAERRSAKRQLFLRWHREQLAAGAGDG